MRHLRSFFEFSLKLLARLSLYAVVHFVSVTPQDYHCPKTRHLSQTRPLLVNLVLMELTLKKEMGEGQQLEAITGV